MTDEEENERVGRKDGEKKKEGGTGDWGKKRVGGMGDRGKGEMEERGVKEIWVKKTCSQQEEMKKEGGVSDYASALLYTIMRVVYVLLLTVFVLQNGNREWQKMKRLKATSVYYTYTVHVHV